MIYMRPLGSFHIAEVHVRRLAFICFPLQLIETKNAMIVSSFLSISFSVMYVPVMYEYTVK